MKKKLVMLLVMIVMVFSFVACSKDKPAEDLPLNQELVKLLPQEGFKWAYNGAAEYYHEMVLESITADDKQAIFKITGEVEDISSGEGNKDYGIELYYEISGDSLKQRKTAPMMLDSEYDVITIIKAPLETGTKWTEEVKDQSGRKVTIEASIIEVVDDEQGKIYRVSYKNKKTGYAESRKIMENFGVIAFTKLVEVDGQAFTYGYGLYGLGSGYIAKTEPTDSTDSTDSTDTATDSTDTTDTTTDSTDTATDTTDTTTDNTDTATDTTDTTTESTDTSEEDEKAIIKSRLIAFNDSWIEFVNNNNQSYFDYITSDGVAYKNAQGFNRTGLTEKFLEMRVNQINVAGNSATAKVYEEIQKTKDGQVTVAKYNWIYNLEKKNGVWLIDGYKKQ
jgi:cytoskeletal protein RodZ